MMEFLKGTVTPRDWMWTGLILAAAAVLVGVFWLLVYKSQNETLDALEADLTTARANLDKGRQIEREIGTLREETRRIRELVNDFQQRLPASSEIDTLFKQFENLASEVGVQVSVEQRPKRTDQRKQTIPYAITARGDFHQIASFINRLERFKRYLKVSELSIGPEEAGISEAKFTLSTYRFLQTPPAAVAEPQGSAS